MRKFGFSNSCEVFAKKKRKKTNTKIHFRFYFCLILFIQLNQIKKKIFFKLKKNLNQNNTLSNLASFFYICFEYMKNTGSPKTK